SGALHLGRLAFMDRVLVYDRQKLSLYSCSRGIVFPREWELPSGQVEPLTRVDAEFLDVCRQMFASSRLPEKVIAAWKTALAPSTPPSLPQSA
ncbi:MAG TPA: hypothetical protein PKO06_19885, partial [Candidatus Ozemobacteraceae bacterium]|nr:hypothetical protein [Candidatus Ozemobacteraceae bacterium]